MRRISAVLLLPLLLCSCVSAAGREYEISAVTEESGYTCMVTEDVTLNGIWISQFDITDIWCDEAGQRPRDEFASAVKELCAGIAAGGYNAVFVQVRPYGDSFYPSAFYPPSAYAVGAYGNTFTYDPLEIFLSCAHSAGLEFHAWINPYRLMKTDEVCLLPEDSLIRRCADAGMFAEYDGRLYILPSDIARCRIILDGVRELVTGYAVDGVHIDDYFYPTSDPSFDGEAFSLSGESDMLAWRRNNVSRLVKEIYSVVKECDRDCVFGVSPAGNIDYSYNYCCADIYLWCSSEGYLDYILPQVYFGYSNPVCPFSETLDNWISVVTNPDIRLYTGLAAYKVGATDAFAGAMSNEWIDTPGMLSRQIAESKEKTDGCVLFSYRYVFGKDVPRRPESKRTLPLPFADKSAY